MGIIGWIILGLATGVAASRLDPGLRSRGAALAGITGTAGGWPAAWRPPS
jgi:uncharacterized membrane protein YeaQ/YmgE (transglycosylase-associated protein family)